MGKIKHCLQCGKKHINTKFCSKKCLAKTRKPTLCKICNTKIHDGWISTKYCDICRYTKNPNFQDWSKITFQDLHDKLPTCQVHARIRGLSRCIYNKSPKPKECFNCKYSKHYEVCHIKPINSFDKNTPISIINDIENLISLCPNCHWEFDHGILSIPF